MPRANQLSVFLPNSPGELQKLCERLREHGVNILAVSIQNARDYVEELMRAREQGGKRLVLAESYRGVLREQAETSVVRLVVEPFAHAEERLREAGYVLDIEPVLCLHLEHRAGVLLEVARRFAEAGLNLDYVYGSAMAGEKRALFVCHVADLERGEALFDPSGNVP